MNVVALLGLRLAILNQIGGWRCLLLDDMENLQASRRRRLLEQLLVEAREGRLDNFIGAWVAEDADGLAEVPEGVKIIRLHP